MDSDQDKPKGRGQQFKKALKNTLQLFKPQKEKSGGSSAADIHDFLRSKSPVVEQENQPLRQSEDERQLNSDSAVDAHLEIPSIQSTPSTLVNQSPASVLHHRNPGHRPTTTNNNNNWPMNTVANNLSPLRSFENNRLRDRFEPSNPSHMMENRPSQEPGHQAGEQQPDYTEEKKELRAKLQDMYRRHVHLMDIGKYLIDNYYNRDEMLEKMVTRMVDREEQYDNIANSVLDWFGLVPDPMDFPYFVRSANNPGPGTGGNRPIRLPPPRPRDAAPGQMIGPRPMGNTSTQSDIPSRDARTPPNFVTDDDFPFRARGPMPELVRPIPRRPAPIVPRWPEELIEQTKQELDERDAEMARRELEAGNINNNNDDDDYAPPMVQPATMERIQRGYYDEALDGDLRPENNGQEGEAGASNPGTGRAANRGRYYG